MCVLPELSRISCAVQRDKEGEVLMYIMSGILYIHHIWPNSRRDLELPSSWKNIRANYCKTSVISTRERGRERERVKDTQVYSYMYIYIYIYTNIWFANPAATTALFCKQNKKNSKMTSQGARLVGLSEVLNKRSFVRMWCSCSLHHKPCTGDAIYQLCPSWHASWETKSNAKIAFAARVLFWIPVV